MVTATALNLIAAAAEAETGFDRLPPEQRAQVVIWMVVLAFLGILFVSASFFLFRLRAIQNRDAAKLAIPTVPTNPHDDDWARRPIDSQDAGSPHNEEE